MSTINNISPASLLVDQEYATIPYSAAMLRFNEPVTVRRDTFTLVGCHVAVSIIIKAIVVIR